MRKVQELTSVLKPSVLTLNLNLAVIMHGLIMTMLTSPQGPRRCLLIAPFPTLHHLDLDEQHQFIKVLHVSSLFLLI